MKINKEMLLKFPFFQIFHVFLFTIKVTQHSGHMGHIFSN